MALSLCLMSVVCFGQAEYSTRIHTDGWDYIGHILPITEKGNVDLSNYNSYIEYVKLYNLPSNVEVRNRINMPSESVLHNYIIGRRCFYSGKVFVSVGLLTSIVGAICIWQGSYNTTAVTTGYTLLGIGSSFISVSIPLLCWGDHIKRECNMMAGK